MTQRRTVERTLVQTEAHLYGSSRLGVDKVNRLLLTQTVTEVFVPFSKRWVFLGVTGAPTVQPDDDSLYLCMRGKKRYEFSNHLGNVMTTLTDRRVWQTNRWVADAVSGQDYDPFGMLHPNRSASDDGYRFGFNGKEKDTEFSNESYDFGARIYDGRVARWLSVDPIFNSLPDLSPYSYAANNPILLIDELGEAPKLPPLFDAENFKKVVQASDRTLYNAFIGAQNTSLSALQKAAWKSDEVNWNTVFGIIGEAEIVDRLQNNILSIQNQSAVRGWSSSGVIEASKAYAYAKANTMIKHAPDSFTDIEMTTSIQPGVDVSFNMSFNNIKRDFVRYNDLHRQLGLTPPLETKAFKVTTTFIFEVKSVAADNIMNGLIKGVDQLVKNQKVINGGVPVLVMDQGNFAEWAAKQSDATLDKAFNLIQQLQNKGGGLVLEGGMNQNIRKRQDQVINIIRTKTKEPPKDYYKTDSN